MSVLYAGPKPFRSTTVVYMALGIVTKSKACFVLHLASCGVTSNFHTLLYTILKIAFLVSSYIRILTYVIALKRNLDKPEAAVSY